MIGLEGSFARAALSLSLAIASAGCGGTSSLDDAGAHDTSGADTAGLDAPALDAPDAIATDAGPPGVAVSHARELRAVWVSTVFRLDFPATAGASESAVTAELQGIVDLAIATGLNAIYFQVRPESDALYTSTIEPWSRFLSGTQGTDPGYDPLGILLDLAHPAGIEVHAWVNPLRGMTSTSVTTASNHVTRTLSDAAIRYDGGITMDPADARVRDHVVLVVTDIVRRYDVDGVVFDDYFYPYPDDAGAPFPDDDSFAAYRSGGGTLSRSDWRRENVNTLIAAVSAAIEAEEPWVRFGISPFGIYQPGMPPGVTGLNAYEVIACDSLRWIDEGWIDYIAPQIYWASTSTGQPFGDLIAWWADQSSPSRPVIPALGAYRMAAPSNWMVSELVTQVELTRAEGASAAGQSWFRLQHLEASAALRDAMADLNAVPARPPAVPGRDGLVVAPPSVVLAGTTVTLGHEGDVSGFAIYRDDGSGYVLARWAPRGTTSITLAAGDYAITAIDRGGAESLGVELTVP